MARRKRSVHEIQLRERRGNAVCWYQGREWWFGAWDTTLDKPTADALDAFQRQIVQWSSDPGAGLRADEYLIAQLALDWLKSDASPPAGRPHQIAAESVDWLNRVHAATVCTSFGPSEFLAWQTWLCQQNSDVRKRRMRRATILKHRSNIIRMVKFGVVTGRVRADQLTGILAVSPPAKHLTEPSQKRMPVSGQTVKSTLGHLSPELQRFVRLSWWTGARVEELASLTVTDIVRSGWVETPFAVRLNLDRFQGRVWAAVLVRHKAQETQDRVLFFGPRAQKVLREIFEAAGDGPLFSPSRGRKSKRFHHKLYHQGTIRNAILRAAKMAGVPRWVPRQMRQAFARRMVSKGLGERVVACCLGHTSRKVTARYTDRDLVTAAKVYAKYG